MGDLAVTLVGLLVPLGVALASTWAAYLSRPSRPEGEGDHEVADPQAQDDRALNSWRHSPVLGVRIVHYATHLKYYREVWELGPSPRGWHLVAQSQSPLVGRRLPATLLVCGDIARIVAKHDAAGWPMLTEPTPDHTLE